MKRITLLTFTIFLATFPLASDSGDIDSLFDDVEDVVVTDETSDNKEDEADAVESLLEREGFQFGATFNASIGYTSGWEVESDDDSDEEEDTDSTLMLMSSKLTLDAQVNDSFRFLQSYSIAFPAFEPKVSEFFADFDFGDTVYFRLGRQNLTWGISRYYKFTNLHARLPDNFGYVYDFDDEGEHLFDNDGYYKMSAIDPSDDISNNDSYSLKLDVPVGIGGFQGLMYTRNGFFEDASSPSMDELGWGGYFNLAIKEADLTLGGFYHKDMNLRGFFSASTTLFDRLELYSEAVISYDHGKDDLLPIPEDAEPDDDGYFIPEEDPDDRDFGANLGFYVDFLDSALELTGEYYYNGEETELEPLGTKLGLPLVWGHNLAFGAAVNLLDDSLKIEAYTLYNASENTGVAAPVITWKGFGFLELKAALPFVYGSEEGTYFIENPDVMDRRSSFVLTAKVSGRI